ncbi:MAG: SHOCT domain-containing protein [Desulfosalsimonadaceae bacterium]
MKQTAAIFITGIMLLFSTACGTARWVRTPVLEGSRTTVNLEYRVEKDQILPQHYDHPYRMATLDVAKLLGDLVYTERGVLIGGDKETPVFQAEEIEALAPALTDALAKATPDERIHFISFNKGGGLLFKNTRKTEGILFVEPKGRINLAFGLINADVMDADSEDSPQIYTNSDPLKIRYADTALVPAAYAVMKDLETGKPAPMWVVADAVKLAEAVASAPKPTPAIVTPSPAPAPAPVSAAPEKAAKPVIAPQPATPAVTPQAATQEDIKNKLKYLKDLYEGGLISEPEYAAEKKKLLDKID